MSDTTNHKCELCGGDLLYDGSPAWNCDTCGSAYDDQFKRIPDKYDVTPASAAPQPGATLPDLAAIRARKQRFEHLLIEGIYTDAEAVEYAEDATRDITALLAIIDALQTRIQEIDDEMMRPYRETDAANGGPLRQDAPNGMWRYSDEADERDEAQKALIIAKLGRLPTSEENMIGTPENAAMHAILDAQPALPHGAIAVRRGTDCDEHLIMPDGKTRCGFAGGWLDAPEDDDTCVWEPCRACYGEAHS